MCCRLGLPTKVKRYTAEQLESIRRAHADGLTDTDIAKRVGIERRAVTLQRARMGLGINQEARHRAQLKSVANQKKTLGLNSMGELRTRSYRRFAVENGWPADMRPREVQILNVLSQTPGLTRRQLATVIGMNDRKRSKNLLCCKYGRGSYTANLIHQGYIVGVQRFQPFGTRRNGKGNSRLEDVYVLTEKAISMIEARGAAQKGGDSANTCGVLREARASETESVRPK